jgi:DNA anti-recombination protein RmuC
LESIIIIILCIIVIALIFAVFKKNNGSNSDVIIQLSNNLSNQIQDIRKEINDNSEKSRLEIESKLKVINKEISDFQISSKSSMQKQFADSNKIIKDVTNELAKIKGTNEQVLSFANQMKSLEKILGNQKQRGIFGEIQLENLLSNV